MACSPPAPTFDNPSSWSVTHNSGTCNNDARINVSAGCGSSGYTIELRRIMPDLSDESIYSTSIPAGPISGTEFQYDEVPECSRGDVTYYWRILCEGVVQSTSDSISVAQGGAGQIVATDLDMDDECRITAHCRISNPNCGECVGTLKLYRNTGVVPTFVPGEVVFSAPTGNSPYANEDFEYSETLGDGTYFYAWRLINFDGGVDDESEPRSVNPECNPYIVAPVALPAGELEKHIVLVKVTGTPATGWTYEDKKILTNAEQRLEWWYHKNGGCGSFRLMSHEFLEDYFDDALAQAWEIHVRIKLAGEYEYTNWYRGVIRSIRQQEQGAETYLNVDGYGYLEMLNKIQVQRSYPAGWTVKDVVNHIIQNYVRPYSRVLVPQDVDPTNGDDGIDPSPYVLQKDVHFECSALKAIKFLAELQGNREFGVDADRFFYFRQSTTTVRKAFFVGLDLLDRIAGGKTFGAANTIKVAGKSFGARDLLKVQTDVTDVTANGLYEVPHEVPWVTGDADASHWADNIIEKHKTTQEWSILQWQGITSRVDASHPIGRVSVYGSDVSNDIRSYDVAKIQYIEGGWTNRQHVDEIGNSKIQSSLDQPGLRARFYLGQYPRDLIEELEIEMHEQIEALKGRHKQYRYPNDVTLIDVSGRLPGEIKHYSKNVTNHDVTNDPAELQDVTNPRGVMMAWIDNQWVKLSTRRTVHTLPARGKFIGEVISLITDSTLAGYGELRWWNGSGWQILSQSTGAITGAGANPRVAFWNGVNTLTGDAGLTYDAAADALTVAGYLRVGTATDAAAQGDFSAGIGGGNILFWSATSGYLNCVSNNGSQVAALRGVSVNTYLTFNRITTDSNNVRIGVESTSDFVLYSDTVGGVAFFPQAGGPFVWNENGVDADFRVEGDTLTHLFFCDASTDRVGIGAAVPEELLHVGGNILLPNASWLKWKNAAGTNKNVIRVDGSNNITIGEGSGTGLNTDIYADTLMRLAAGGFYRLQLNATEAIFNEDGANWDFRVEGDTITNVLFVDASIDALIAGNYLDVGTSTLANVQGAFAAGLTGNQQLHYDVTSGGLFLYGVGAFLVNRLSVTAGSATVFNEWGADTDFRIEGDNDPNLLALDASVDAVAIGVAPGSIAVSTKFQIKVATNEHILFRSLAPNAAITTQNDAGSAFVPLDIVASQICLLPTGNVGVGTASPQSKFHVLTAGDATGILLGEQSLSTGKQLTMGYYITSNFGFIQAVHQGTDFTVLHLNKAGGGVVINDDGGDYDGLRVESDDESYCLMVEGTLNNIVLCANVEPGFQSMDGGVFLAEANVVPTGNPTAGGYIYVEGGALKYRGTGGTITTLGPT